MLHYMKKSEQTFWPTQYSHLICWHSNFEFCFPCVITIGIALHAAKSELPMSAFCVCPKPAGGQPIHSYEPGELLIVSNTSSVATELGSPCSVPLTSHGRSWVKHVLPLSHSFLTQRMGILLALPVFKKFYWRIADLQCCVSVRDSEVIQLYTQSFFFHILFPFRSSQRTEQSSLCSTVGPCWLSNIE